MHAQVKLASGRVLSVDLSRGIDICIPLDFVGGQPSAFGAVPASADPFSVGEYVLDTRQGGSCNVRVITVNPHCNGTHTESALHVTHDGPHVLEVAPLGFIGATLLSVEPVLGATTDDEYHPAKRPDDRLVTKRALEPLAEMRDASMLEAVVLRTLPNDSSKCTCDYAKHAGPYLSIPAIEFLVGLGVKHLVVDMASVDRADDDGLLRVHRIWFGVTEGPAQDPASGRSGCTITEMAFIADDVPDGPYLLQLQIAPFLVDASPSRVILFAPNDSWGA